MRPSRRQRAGEKVWRKHGEWCTLQIDGEADQSVRVIWHTVDSDPEPAELDGAQRLDVSRGVAVRRASLRNRALPLGAVLMEVDGEEWRIDTITADYGTDIRALVVPARDGAGTALADPTSGPGGDTE